MRYAALAATGMLLGGLGGYYFGDASGQIERISAGILSGLFAGIMLPSFEADRKYKR